MGLFLHNVIWSFVLLLSEKYKVKHRHKYVKGLCLHLSDKNSDLSMSIKLSKRVGRPPNLCSGQYSSPGKVFNPQLLKLSGGVEPNNVLWRRNLIFHVTLDSHINEPVRVSIDSTKDNPILHWIGIVLWNSHQDFVAGCPILATTSHWVAPGKLFCFFLLFHLIKKKTNFLQCIVSNVTVLLSFNVLRGMCCF